LFYAIPYLIGVEPSLIAELSVVPLVLNPLSFAYAIIKYRLMDVEVLFKRGVVFALATGAVIALYLAIFLLGTSYLVNETNSTIIALLATMVVVLVFTPIKSKIQVAIDRLFYRESFDYRRALLAFSRDLNAHLDIDHLSARMVERISNTFDVEKVALLVPDEDRGDLEILAEEGLSEDEMGTVRIQSDSALFARLAKGESVYHGEFDWSSFRAGAHHDKSGSGFLMIDGFQYAIPCLVQGKVVGVILLGRRWDQNALSSEDMELLLTLSGQAATALENARLYRSLELKAEQFERLKEHSENTIESLEAGILVLDLSGKVVRWNRSLEGLYGVSRDEALGQTIEELFPASFQEVLRASMGREWWVRAEPTGISRMNLFNRHGEDKVVKLQVAPFISEEEETQGAIMIFEDVTSRVELERELKLREKMASLGLLAAGVAHEVNTPLTGISSFTQMLLDQTGKEDTRVKLLEKIERQTERASKIVNSLLNFARQGRSDFVPVDINEVVGDVLSLLEHQLTRGRIKVRRELEPDVPEVLGDENKLQQIFLNLILNAQEAMPSGGWLTIKTSHQGSEVSVDVSDTGHGISKEDIKRIYDLFFTTKRGGRSGTGLGLSITYGIIQEHSGHISVESAIGKGTRFQIKLPTYKKMAAEASRGGQAQETEPRAQKVRGS
jgi:PAS domain S-box-containing protein